MNSGDSHAFVPRITRLTPQLKAALTFSTLRIPPPGAIRETA